MSAQYGRPLFDRAANFVVRNGPLTVNGVKFQNGELIDKSALTPRRLQLLFEQRKLEIRVSEAVVAVIDDSDAEAAPAASAGVLAASTADKSKPKAVAVKA